MNNYRKIKLVFQIASRVKLLFQNLLIFPYKAEIIEMILTAIDFLDAISSEFG